jgi:hypothetical protein
MFPRPSIRHLADALLEVADAALQPQAGVVSENGDVALQPQAGVVSEAADVAEAHRMHPHRRPVRIERVRRRGATPPQSQHCITPVTRASRRDDGARAASRER